MVYDLVMLLAGGRGSRLNILGSHRAKPAVPFAGMYRIIDFALSSCMYARLLKVGVLTQYRPVSLLSHLGDGSHWDMDGKAGLLKNLPPFQASEDFDWYHGTADAVHQNLSFIRRYRPERVLVLSGDHIYRMRYRKMIDFHKKMGAALTIAAMPVPFSETHRFGIIVANDKHEVVEFQEKPKESKSNLASMGIYVFEAEALEQELAGMAEAGGTDFGKHVIPGMLEKYKCCVYPFEGYWRDVGTIDSYFEANMDVFRADSGINLFDWRPRTNLAYEDVQSMPAARIKPYAKVSDAMISPGCIIEGRVERSVLSPGVVVAKGAVVKDSIIMHRSMIGRDAVLERAIVDKHCRIGDGAHLVGSPGTPANIETPDHLSTGLVVAGRNCCVPPDLAVGSNVIIHPDVREDSFSASRVQDGLTVKKN
jgi:glucose-1-phosphate adenylyltransferase